MKIKYKGIIPVSHSNEPTYDEAKKVYEHYSLENTIVWFLPEILRDNILGVSRSLRGILNKMIYLGPLRTYPSRHFAFSSFQQDANWVSGGGQAWDILLKDKKLRDKVNKWLNDPERLDIPYQFEVRQLFPESDIESEILSLFDYQVDYDSNDMEDDDLGIPPDIMGEAPFVNLLIRYMKKHDLDYDYENFAVHIINALKSRKFSGLSELVLMDPRLNIPLSHRDVGVGISQVLPVLVEALFNRNKLLLIEEPDIHVHPGLQAKLGDLFIESALSNGNTLMLESHSEHLLLRLLRRLRERYTTSRDRALTPDDIGILFIEREKGKSVVRELEIDEKGNFIGDWPQNFFAERAQELF